MKKNNLIVFATFWNEIDWIKSSLVQIEKLNPMEVIICDGCFDDSKVNKSTDGTREIIKSWVSKRDNARIISAIRVSKFRGFCKIFFGHKKIKWYYLFTPGRLKALYLSLISNRYRVNQALTFQKMISLSKHWQPGFWTTNIDCDQFFSDHMFKIIEDIVNSKSDYGILVANENTFFNDFNTYTTDYEKRNYNNMPHRIYKNTTFIPTRGTILENWSLKSFNIFKNFFKSDFYINQVKSKHLGTYNHYKFKFSNSRLTEGYNLGDRKAPVLKDYKFKKFTKEHPKIIYNNFKTNRGNKK